MAQKYLEEVLVWIGTKEIKGTVSNPDIVKFASYTSLKATSDEIAWCSSFANFIVSTCGDKGTNSAAARSWLDWGVGILIPDMQPGDIVILDRHDGNNPNAAHVTFFVCWDENKDYIWCIGGNQSDMVKQSKFKVSTILGVRNIN